LSRNRFSRFLGEAVRQMLRLIDDTVCTVCI